MFVVRGVTALGEEVGCGGAFADYQEEGSERGDAGGDNDDVHFDAMGFLARADVSVCGLRVHGLGDWSVDRLKGRLLGMVA